MGELPFAWIRLGHSRKAFMKWANFLDWGKLRASYGTSGKCLTILTWPHGLMRVVKGPFKAKVELRQVRPLVRI